MPLRSLLRRASKSKLSATDKSEQTLEKVDAIHAHGQDDGSDLAPPIPIVKIMRQTTHSQELLSVPSYSPVATMQPHLPLESREKSSPDRNSQTEPGLGPKRSDTVKSSKSKRLSNLLHLNRRSRAGSNPSMPQTDLTPFEARPETLNGKTDEERQAQWEKRATLLVQDTTKPVSLPPSPGPPMTGQERTSYDFSRPSQPTSNSTEDWPLRTPSVGTGDQNAATAKKSIEQSTDDDIQLAIQLHESGDLQTSTSMFGRLADPNGANNALAQVLYGLALRHGWGISTDPDLAVQYLTASARNASQLTSSLTTATANPSSPSKPTLNRGELTLAIYELGNCHRNGWGVAKSPALAMQYFETAAELGDADAMVDVAAAWEKGVKGWHGGKKDRGMAAKWYRRAERAGRKEVGLSWIWKEKYDEFDDGEDRSKGKHG